MTALCALLALVAIAAIGARPKWHELDGYTFDRYTVDFRKTYRPTEVAMRAALFATKLEEVRRFNANPKRSYHKGINHLSDRTPKELAALRGSRPVHAAAHAAASKVAKVGKEGGAMNVPFAVNYAKAVPPILTAVKDQGDCGSCWAHAATEQIETFVAIKTGNLPVLSQQQLVSCVQNPQQCGGTGGCAGATAELAFDYIATKAFGMTQEWMYSYQSYFGVVPSCAYNATKMTPFAKLQGYIVNKRNDPNVVMEALATVGPLAISVDASQWSDYESGIYKGCNYAKNITMDHAVQLVGYGTDAALGMDYWIVRNSWSPDWGEAGFIRLYKERGSPECGWNNDWDTDGGGCKGDPNTVWACGECGILYDTVYPVVLSD